MDKEMQQFQDDLLASVRQMKEGKKSRITTVEPTLAAIARTKVEMTQIAFSKLLGVSVRTLQEWEQGRRSPTGAAKTLLGLAIQNPMALRSFSKQA
jgi:putative transcriptional regulator